MLAIEFTAGAERHLPPGLSFDENVSVQLVVGSNSRDARKKLVAAWVGQLFGSMVVVGEPWPVVRPPDADLTRRGDVHVARQQAIYVLLALH